MSKKKAKKQQKTEPLAVSSKEQAIYTPPGVDTVEAMNAEEISKSLSPSRLANLVNESKKGNGFSLVTLALEMREEDASFGGNLRTRKLAVLNQPRTLQENPQSTHAKANELIIQLLGKRYFNKLLYCLLEATEVGYAVVRLVWQASENGYWLPVSVHRVDPRRVGFDPNSEQYFWRNFDDPEDRKNIIDGSGLEYMVYTPDEVLMPNRGGLARLAAFAFMAKRFSLNDWVKFLSSVGMPLRVGKYEPSAQSEERQILKRALQMLGSDKAAAIPKNTDIEFLEANNSEGATFKSLAEYLDKQIAVAVLGQTLTSGTEGGGSYALGQVHDNVRLDILRADCVSITAELQELVEKICSVNFGPDSAPHLSIKPKLQKDLQKLAGVVTTLASGGLDIPKSWLYEEFGIPEPKQGEEVLGSPDKPTTEAKQESERNKDEVNAWEISARTDIWEQEELNELALDDSGDPDEELNRINDKALEYDYQANNENAVMQALNSSRNFKQFQKKIAKIALAEPDKRLVQALTLAATKGALLGERDGEHA